MVEIETHPDVGPRCTLGNGKCQNFDFNWRMRIARPFMGTGNIRKRTARPSLDKELDDRMIGYLEGRLLRREDERILLLVQHVGYDIYSQLHVEPMYENGKLFNLSEREMSMRLSSG